MPELIENHLWEPLGRDHGWLIADFSTTQTGKDLLASYEKRKAYDRQRKARAKLAKITADQSDSGGISGETIPVDSYRPDPNRLKQPRRQEISANSKQPNPVDLDGQPLCSVCHKRPALGERATGWRDSTRAISAMTNWPRTSAPDTTRSTRERPPRVDPDGEAAHRS